MPRVNKDGKVGRKDGSPPPEPKPGFAPEDRVPKVAPSVASAPTEVPTEAPDPAPAAATGDGEQEQAAGEAPAPEGAAAGEAGAGEELGPQEDDPEALMLKEDPDGTVKLCADGEEVVLVPLLDDEGNPVLGSDGLPLYMFPEEEEEEEEVFEIGDRVQIHSMVQTELMQLNGMRGSVVDVKPHGLHVRVDGRGKWLVLPSFLDKLKDPVIDLRETSVYIVGTWDDWKKPMPMTWDKDKSRFRFKVEVGKDGQESFQIQVEDNVEMRIHPDKADANSFVLHNLCGPDNLGKGKNWTIGKHEKESQAAGISYEVLLIVKDNGSAKKVEWNPLLAKEEEMPPKYESISICASAFDWKAKEMTWNAARRHYHIRLTISREGEEGFQIWVNGNSKQCLHPDVNDACAYVKHMLCGPDDKGHEKNWTMGKHPQEGNCIGFMYDVRLWVRDDGAPNYVDWTRIKDPVKLPKYQSIHIAGTWNKWKQSLRMSFDEARMCYHYKVVLGHQCWESFQILVDGDWKKCLYPDREDGNMHNDWCLCGPDEQNHGKNWTIGRHPKEQGSKGQAYEVRLWLTKEGRARKVDYVRHTEALPAPPTAAEAAATASAVAAESQKPGVN